MRDDADGSGRYVSLFAPALGTVQHSVVANVASGAVERRDAATGAGRIALPAPIFTCLVVSKLARADALNHFSPETFPTGQTRVVSAAGLAQRMASTTIFGPGVEPSAGALTGEFKTGVGFVASQAQT